MTFCRSLFVLMLLPAVSLSQTTPAKDPVAAATVPAGTPLALEIGQNYRMRAGETIRAYLLYPIYADNHLVLPANTIVTGTVVALHADRKRRVGAMLGGDFTPFRTPEVRFTSIVLADGTSIPLAAASAVTGTQIYRAVAARPTKGGIVHQEFDSGLDAARGDLAFFIAPGKGDRLLQWVYARLPYHPQSIAKGTSWTVEAAAPIDVPAEPEVPAVAAAPARKPHFWDVQTPAAPNEDNGAWIVQANLADSLSSETSTAGQAIKAVVAEPIYNPDQTIAVPQGATLVGTVTRAKPARHFGRTGVLSFSFSQLVLPNQQAQTVETRLTGADSAADIALNSEGQAESKPQDKIAIPLILALMAARPLDQDAGHRGGGPRDATGKNAEGGAAGLALVGTIVGIAGGSPYAAAGIGYWGAARAVYSRWIARGQKITFAKDTRIVVETTPRRSAPITANPPPSP